MDSPNKTLDVKNVKHRQVDFKHLPVFVTVSLEQKTEAYSFLKQLAILVQKMVEFSLPEQESVAIEYVFVSLPKLPSK